VCQTIYSIHLFVLVNVTLNVKLLVKDAVGGEVEIIDAESDLK
jgi:hypothetical protein